MPNSDTSEERMNRNGNHGMLTAASLGRPSSRSNVRVSTVSRVTLLVPAKHETRSWGSWGLIVATLWHILRFWFKPTGWSSRAYAVCTSQSASLLNCHLTHMNLQCRAFGIFMRETTLAMNFLKSLWHEGAPILRHGIVTASIILVAAILLKLSSKILPPDYLDLFRRVDHILFVVLCWMFSVYTVAFLFVLLSRSIYTAAVSEGEPQRRSIEPGHSGNRQATLGPGEQDLALTASKKISAPQEKSGS
jgi:hypothetical protein